MLCFSFVVASNTSVYASNECVDTALFGQYCDDGQGSGIWLILTIALTVMTFGVGIAGVLGIVISGIQYATAGDNEAQVAKAKQRILQIVIGLAIWATMYAFLGFLLPNFSNGGGSGGGGSGSGESGGLIINQSIK